MSTDLFDTHGRQIIVLDNPDGSDLFDASGRPYKVVAGGIVTNGGSATIDIVQNLTIDSGSVSPAAPGGMLGNIALTGQGDMDDDLVAISAGAAFSGKMIILRKAGNGAITLKKSTNLVLAADFILNSPDDVICLEWQSSGVWREHYRCNCG
jgi:hypothetical protein